MRSPEAPVLKRCQASGVSAVLRRGGEPPSSPQSPFSATMARLPIEGQEVRKIWMQRGHRGTHLGEVVLCVSVGGLPDPELGKVRLPLYVVVPSWSLSWARKGIHLADKQKGKRKQLLLELKPSSPLPSPSARLPSLSLSSLLTLTPCSYIGKTQRVAVRRRK